MYASWNVPALKSKLREKGASTRGRKADLIERLDAYGRNYNFAAYKVDEEEEDLGMILPEVNAFRYINSSMELPPLTKEHIFLYFLQFQKKPDDGKVLYESRFLHVLRAAFVGDSAFFKGLVKASMKRILYETNVKIKSNGEIEETMCECVAGSGVSAYCKHVAVVVCGIEHFFSEKILLKTETPTEKLQMFHKPKKIFTGSPMKTHKLPSKRKSMENIVFKPYKLKIDAEHYNKRVRSILLNCESRMPFKQLYEPANPFAIDNDHTYCGSLTLSVLFIKKP